MTSHWVLSETGKCFKVKGNVFFEVVGDTLYPCNADIFHKEAGRYYVGYKNTEGTYTVYKKDGLLNISEEKGQTSARRCVPWICTRILLANIFPKLEDDNRVYHERKDGMVERVTLTDAGSAGRDRRMPERRSCKR